MSITLNGTTGITSSGGYTGDGLSVADNAPANALQIDASGNLGIGTTSPAGKLSVISGSTSTATDVIVGTVDTRAWTIRAEANDGIGYSLRIGPSFANSYGRHLIFATGGSDTERARIDSSGNLLVGTTTKETRGVTVYGSGANGMYVKTTGTCAYFITQDGTGGSGTLQTFYSNTTAVGSITTSGTTTSYNTSSDYRLKENIQPITGALAKVAQLKPVTYKWKADGSDGEGFIAHELKEVVPQAVTGEKDAVDAEGNPQYQGIDTSFLAGLYAAAIQELKAMVDAQAVEIAQLKGQA